MIQHGSGKKTATHIKEGKKLLKMKEEKMKEIHRRDSE